LKLDVLNTDSRHLNEKRISNIEQGIMNFEGRCSIDLFSFEKVRAERFHTSIFCGSLFPVTCSSLKIPKFLSRSAPAFQAGRRRSYLKLFKFLCLCVFASLRENACEKFQAFSCYSFHSPKVSHGVGMPTDPDNPFSDPDKFISSTT